VKFNIQIEDEDVLCDLIDDMFVSLLNRELKSTQEFLDNDGWKHPDDVKVWKKNIKALKVLIKYYGGDNGADSN
jgi:hypothetical protein